MILSLYYLKLNVSTFVGNYKLIHCKPISQHSMICEVINRVSRAPLNVILCVALFHFILKNAVVLLHSFVWALENYPLLGLHQNVLTYYIRFEGLPSKIQIIKSRNNETV